MKSKLCVFLLTLTGFVSAASAQNLTNFVGDTQIDAVGGWNFDVVTGFISGNNTQGSGLYDLNPSFQDYSGVNQISMTGFGGAFEFGGGNSFIATLTDNNFLTASAVFAFESFYDTSTTVVSTLSASPGFDFSNVYTFRITSSYTVSGPTEFDSVKFTNASASFGTAPAKGIGGNVLTNFGSNVTPASSPNYDAATSTFTPQFMADQIFGNATTSSFAGATQVSLTASADLANVMFPGAPPMGSPFTYYLQDDIGGFAYAAFDWTQFQGGVKTVQSTLVAEPGFNSANVIQWGITNLTNPAGNQTISATLYGAAGLSPTQTDTVVDGFGDAVSQFVVSYPSNPSVSVNSTVTLAGYDDALREIQSDIDDYDNPNAEAAAQVADGNYLLVTTDSQDSINQITYSGFSLYATEQHFLRFDFNGVQNLKELAVDLGNGLLPTVSGTFTVPDSEFASSSFLIDLSQLPNWTPEFASGIDSLNVIFDTPSGNMLVELDQIAFTSIPEPSTYALLALGAAFALGRILRKRRASA